MDLLRFTTAGSVDDGKSTLIGRLLYDSKAIFEDQLAAIERVTEQRGEDHLESRAPDRRPAGRARAGDHDRRRLPLLRHAPAQVHHRRHPGPHPVHAQHGDRRLDGEPRARPGRRAAGHRGADPAARVHRLAAAHSAPGDLREQDGSGGFPRGRVREDRRREFSAFASRLEVPDIKFIPISALHGDNVVEPSTRMPWFRGSHAALHAGDRLYRERRQPRRPAVSGAVGHPAELGQASRLPRPRRPRRRRRVQAGRRGRRAALGNPDADPRTPRARRTGGRGVLADDCRGHARGRHRHRPRRHAGQAGQHAAHQPGRGNHGVLV